MLSKSAKAALFSSQKADWPTPSDRFDEWDQEFGFTLDVCADHLNTTCNKYYTPVDDGLTQPWSGMAWCNPPYGRTVGQWIDKAISEAQHNPDCRGVVLLLPARTDTRWFHDLIWDTTSSHPRTGISVRFLRGRLKFGNATASAPFPSMLVIVRGSTDA